MKTKNISQRFALGVLGVAMAGGIVFTSAPAEAKKSKNWKKAAVAGAAVTGYGIAKGKGRTTTVGAASTVGSYYMYRKTKKDEEKAARERAWYQRRYGRNWRNHYPR